MYVYMYVYTYMYMYIYVCTYVCMMYVCIYACICICMHAEPLAKPSNFLLHACICLLLHACLSLVFLFYFLLSFFPGYFVPRSRCSRRLPFVFLQRVDIYYGSYELESGCSTSPPFLTHLTYLLYVFPSSVVGILIFYIF